MFVFWIKNIDVCLVAQETIHKPSVSLGRCFVKSSAFVNDLLQIGFGATSQMLEPP